VRATTKRKVTFPDDAYLEIVDTAAFDALLADTGHQDSFVVRMQQSWRGALTAVVATLVVLTLSYLYVLPLASEGIAKNAAGKVERSIGKGHSWISSISKSSRQADCHRHDNKR